MKRKILTIFLLTTVVLLSILVTVATATKNVEQQRATTITFSENEFPLNFSFPNFDEGGYTISTLNGEPFPAPPPHQINFSFYKRNDLPTNILIQNAPSGTVLNGAAMHGWSDGGFNMWWSYSQAPLALLFDFSIACNSTASTLQGVGQLGALDASNTWYATYYLDGEITGTTWNGLSVYDGHVSFTPHSAGGSMFHTLLFMGESPIHDCSDWWIDNVHLIFDYELAHPLYLPVLATP